MVRSAKCVAKNGEPALGFRHWTLGKAKEEKPELPKIEIQEVEKESLGIPVKSYQTKGEAYDQAFLKLQALENINKLQEQKIQQGQGQDQGSCQIL